jgi:predicted negative regulator of RcsB-dependent stress response
MSDALALRELPLPAPVSYAPQTIGWAFVALLIVAIVLVAMWFAWKRHERSRYRREALVELKRIEARLNDEATRATALAQIAPLIKRTALAAAPRSEVASLSGASWLAYLNKTHDAFDDESGALMYSASYAPREHLARVTPQQAARLVQAARAWIGHHHVEV